MVQVVWISAEAERRGWVREHNKVGRKGIDNHHPCVVPWNKLMSIPIPIKGTIKRTINLFGVHSPVIVEMTDTWVRMRIPGTKLAIESTWFRIASQMYTSQTAPSFLVDKPLEFLQHQAVKRQKRKEAQTT